MTQKPHFEIGLVLAGAVSAGAYTAGVMDFFIEAIEDYYAAKKEPDWTGPTHDVRTPIITGASAGGMTGSIVAIQVFHKMTHVNPDTPEPASGDNYLYSSWVKQIGIGNLLSTVDLEDGGGVKSLLCSKAIDDIVDHAREKITGAPVSPEWTGRDEERALRLRLTLSNMTGVPYGFNLDGSQDPNRKQYGMLNYGDYRDFKIGGDRPAEEPGTFVLDFGPQFDKDWDELYAAAKATGAFPIGLAPRQIGRPREDYRYSDRVGLDIIEAILNEAGQAKLRRSFERVTPPELFFKDQPEAYRFVSVDGGMVDNEPLELARRYLAGAKGMNDRGAAEAKKAVIMVAPFPNFLKRPEDVTGERLVDVAPRLLGTAIGQARFKPAELELALNPEVYSRFLIAPQRLSGPRAKQGLTEIACGELGAFSGFLHESFRRHDYLLGRRNAQAFLRWHFNLSEENSLFDDFANPARRAEWYVREVGPDGAEGAPKTAEPGKARLLPIIPLTERLRRPIVIPKADYPKWEALRRGTEGRDELDKQIRRRATAVAQVLIDRDLSHFIDAPWPFNLAVGAGVKKFAVDAITKKARAEIDKALGKIEEAFGAELDAAP
jgi:hypothetical protein